MRTRETARITMHSKFISVSDEAGTIPAAAQAEVPAGIRIVTLVMFNKLA
jgi:hypothetical protein